MREQTQMRLARAIILITSAALSLYILHIAATEVWQFIRGILS